MQSGSFELEKNITRMNDLSALYFVPKPWPKLGSNYEISWDLIVALLCNKILFMYMHAQIDAHAVMPRV
jgi:hypothetical protein